MKRIILTSLPVLILDIVTKQIIIHTMKEYQSIPLVANFFSITFAKNTGVAFSFLEGRVPLIIMMTVIILFFIWKYLKTSSLTKLETICYGLIVGGALGNLLDRLIYGYVIDFLDLNFFGYSFPIFNIADSMIVIGIIILLLSSMKESRDMNGIHRR